MAVNQFEYSPFSPKQKRVLTWWINEADRYNGIIADGAIRSGKTLCMSLSFVLWAMGSFDGRNFAMCGKTIESFRRNVWKDLKRMLLAEGFSIIERKSENLIIMRWNGRENSFYVFGGKDERSQDLIQGITLAGLFCDEVVLMPESFVNQATARCSVEGSKWWFNDNPAGLLHWFKVNWIDKTEAKKMLYLHFTMDDNLSLSEEIKARYRAQYSGAFYDRYIKGLWKNAEGLVYSCFDWDRNIITGWNYKPHDPNKLYFASIDYGTVNPFAVCVFEADRRLKQLTMIKDFGWDGRARNIRKDNEGYYEMLEEGLNGLPIQFIVIDPSAAGMKQTILKHKKYNCINANNAVIPGIQKVTEMINRGILKVNQDKCPGTYKELQVYSWDTKAAKEAVIKEDDHYMDALRYAVMEADRRWRLCG